MLLSLFLSHAVACPSPSLDPLNLIRYGDDFLSQPLPWNATLEDCATACCASFPDVCVSFSYNNPQPTRTCVGKYCCEQGKVCCMLKSGMGVLENNTYGKAVRTGYFPAAPLSPGPSPPFSNSTDILGVKFGEVKWWNGTNGDTWPTAWSADGVVLGWDCDAHGSPMSLWQLDGDPYSGDLSPSLVGGLQPINYSYLCGYLGKTGAYPYINVKPAGMAAYGDGSLLTGVSCMNYGDDAGFNRQHNIVGFIARSTDGGISWTNVTTPGELFSGRFASPVFVSCGRANDQGCLQDGYQYIFFPASFDGQSYWDNNDCAYLARALPGETLWQPSSYTFFSGFSADGGVIWTNDSLLAQPVMQFGNMLGENAVTYNPYLKKYLLANYGFIDNNGKPRPWHTQPFMNPHRTQLLLLEADAPWGPWRMFHRDDNSALAPGLYTPTFPSAYLRPINTTTNEATLTMFFSCLDGAPECRYTLNYVTVTLSLAA